MCDTCFTYYSHKPCPNCHPKQKISNAFKSEKISSKSFLIAPTVNELDFMWSQISKKTIQRVQSGNQILRQGFFNFQLGNQDYNFEWVGSTFNQGFFSRLERLYPGTESVALIIDIITQNFNLELLRDILDDVINVNKRYLKDFYVLWLEPYLNSVDQYQDYKNVIKTTLNNYLTDRKVNLEIKEIAFPLYSTVQFSTQISIFLSNLVNDTKLFEYFIDKLPLRPLFRTQRPLLDPNAPNRVIILDLEKNPNFEPTKQVKINLNESVESIKCLACSSEIISNAKICLICKFSFCSRCISFLINESSNSDDFCLGSIYHGVHRASFV